MPPTQHETGLVDGDGAVHAVLKKITGNQAMCGAGLISKPLAGSIPTRVALALRVVTR